MSRVLRATHWLPGVLIALILAGCSDNTTEPGPGTNLPPTATLEDSVRFLAAGRHIGPLERPAAVRPALVTLGQALAFDKVLSGNKDISCMSCHLPDFGTGDGRSLSIGQGGTGLGPLRTHPGGAFIPRNAPALFNLASATSLFLDGRVSVDAQGKYHTPAGDQLTPEMEQVLEFGPVSALPMFPVLSREEMRGQSGNELAAIPDDQVQNIWQGIMDRLGAIPEYRQMFEQAYPGEQFDDMTFAHASNAIGGFIVERLTFNDAPWDRFLAGQDNAMTPEQLRGAKDFMDIKCSICHNGPTFSDNEFHNVAVAQIGPGTGDGPGKDDDFGRFKVLNDAAMKYAFRTPSLRNIVLTGPYGHDGSIIKLRDFIEHYSDSDVKLRDYDVAQLEPALQATFLANVEEILKTRDTIVVGVVLSDEMVDNLTAFMHALTDDPAKYPSVVPDSVPSGLPIDNP